MGPSAHCGIGALGHTPNLNPTQVKPSPNPSARPIQVATTFAETQNSVLIQSKSMQARLGRTNYVTPTNYLELVKGYCGLLKEKRATVGDPIPNPNLSLTPNPNPNLNLTPIPIPSQGETGESETVPSGRGRLYLVRVKVRVGVGVRVGIRFEGGVRVRVRIRGRGLGLVLELGLGRVRVRAKGRGRLYLKCHSDAFTW